MIDFGTYEIGKDEENGKFYLFEQLTGRQDRFTSIENLVRKIEDDLNEVNDNLPE